MHVRHCVRSSFDLTFIFTDGKAQEGAAAPGSVWNGAEINCLHISCVSAELNEW